MKKLLILLSLGSLDALAMQLGDNVHSELVFECSYFGSAADKAKTEVEFPQRILTESYVVQSPFPCRAAELTPHEAAAKVLGLRSSLTLIPVLAPK